MIKSIYESISFLNYIVFEIQYIVSKKSSPFSDNKKSLSISVSRGSCKGLLFGYVKATLFYHIVRLSQLFTQLLDLCLEILDPSLLIFNRLE